ncbi:hypothetical protein [Neomegalonema sp.]|uniref:hypothetical protein n=1 Tax=Neomegalonema sp. TaxID=2039713 RepID=UPI0026171D2A|nr:hypothetical protein [Neomegalonema sp.]MDD2868287.1 hypothetical protein [Neomegalonema sp.]
MGDGFLRKLAAAVLSLGALAAPGAPPAAAESWEARCQGGDAGLCVQMALVNSERALVAAVSERRTELRARRAPDSFAVENDQIQWMARVQNDCAGRAEQAADFDLAFTQCLAELYEARLVEVRASLN